MTLQGKGGGSEQEMPGEPRPNGGRPPSLVNAIISQNTEQILWTAHENTHELEQKALEVALTSADSQITTVQEYIIKYIDAELRKAAADHNNIVEQVRKEWAHHNEVHIAHGIAHEQQHKQTQEALDKAEKTGLSMSNTLAADVQRAVLAQANMVTTPQMISEFKAIYARVELLERSQSVVVGRDTGFSTSWAIVLGVLGAIGITIGVIATLTRL
jgi:hypothetical protein